MKSILNERIFISAFLIGSTSIYFAQNVQVTGKVLNASDQPISGVEIVATNLQISKNYRTTTDSNGNFRFPALPVEGKYTFRANSPEYESRSLSGIILNEKEPNNITLVLRDKVKSIQEVTIVGSSGKASSDKGVLQQQKNTTALLDVMSSDQMKKTGDNNIGQVLKRVAGVTVQDNKFVTVRGMSERYNNVQLNGASLPSSEPNRRNFSFDVVPSGLVDNVLIYKTFTPDLPGEFTGGLVNINTVSVPKNKFFNFSLGTGFNTESTGKTFKTGTVYNSDYFLGNTKERQWFGRDFINDQYSTYFNNLLQLTNPESANAMNSKIPNHWGLKSNGTAMPTVSYELSTGRPFIFKNGDKLGVVVAGTYRHEENTERLLEANYRGYEKYAIQSSTYEFITAMGAVANVGWESTGHKISWKNLYNNRFVHTAMDRLMKNELIYQYGQYSSPVRNTLFQSRLEGEHKLGEHFKVDWFADYNEIGREQNDDRWAQGMVGNSDTYNTDGYLLVDYSNGVLARNLGGAHIMYADLKENKKNIGANVEYNFTIKENKQKLKIGYWGGFRKGNYQQQFLRPMETSLNNLNSLIGMDLSQFYAPENFVNGALYYIIGGRKGNRIDYYIGKQKNNAAYILGEFSFLKNKLHLHGGVRMENDDNQVMTLFNYYDNAQNMYTGKDSLVVRKKTDWLPSVTLIYDITKKLSFRAAYGKTLARPNFRELTPYTYYNIYDRVEVSGELQQLVNTYIQNYDVRLEWYPSSGEIISLSAFYKDFKNPVEFLMYNPSQSGNYVLSPINLESSVAKGLELNVRKHFGFITSGLENLMFVGNASYLKGNVNAGSALSVVYPFFENTKRDRPLAGLSPYMINAGLSWQDEVFGFGANYNISGRKLVIAGDTKYWDEYEAPRADIGLQASAKLWKKRIELKANITNLLNNDYLVYTNLNKSVNNQGVITFNETDDDMAYNDGNMVRSRVKKGTGISFSISYKF